MAGLAALLLAGCGTSDYSASFNEVVPTAWTQTSDSGSIKNGCTTGPNCGSVTRQYQFTGTAQQAAAAFLAQMKTRQCAGQVQGNGISADCANNIHISVSFTTTTASVVITKNATP